MTARDVPVALRLMGIFCIVAGVTFFAWAWIYEMKYL